MEAESSSLANVDYRGHPLIEGIHHVQSRVVSFKAAVKDFYFRVILGNHECPRCGGDLTMVGPSQCSCACGNTFDPTLAFQRSLCCGVQLVRKTLHYVCSSCHETVPSQYLFDERLFDRAYFREMMQVSREDARRKREEIKLLLAGSRSDPLPLLAEPSIDSIPGLTEALNEFVSAVMNGTWQFESKSMFRMDDYRKHILSILGLQSRLFSDISPLIDDMRKDRIWRFVTLIFMAQDREVELTQYGADILVGKATNETDL